MGLKTVLITACSSGFGREIARYLKGKGWYVYATARSENDVQWLQYERFDALQLDLRSQQFN
ncbi:MAG: SDR family NAD(P)-dependent oxidoreductase [Candidatus Omnitrophica bacterium]|nr:SDR family NAD(P)-dependent oxidoreductase [Candidatus Omnitrophota bacterium]